MQVIKLKDKQLDEAKTTAEKTQTLAESKDAKIQQMVAES